MPIYTKIQSQYRMLSTVLTKLSPNIPNDEKSQNQKI